MLKDYIEDIFMSKKILKINGVNIINLTAHPLDLVDAEPNSLTERRVSHTLPVWETLNGKFVDDVEVEGGISFLKRKFHLDILETEKIFSALQQQNVSGKILLVCSLPVVLNYSKQIEDYATAFGLDVRVVGIVSATQRHIKPPVACLKYWSVG